jgi:hypothetical protein
MQSCSGYAFNMGYGMLLVWVEFFFHLNQLAAKISHFWLEDRG